jgi:hypothetical protein
MFVYLRVIMGDPGVMGEEIRRNVEEKYGELKKLREELEEDRESDDGYDDLLPHKSSPPHPLISFSCPSDAILFKHSYITSIQSDSGSPFAF